MHPERLDAGVARRWLLEARDALGASQERADGLDVFGVPDSEQCPDKLLPTARAVRGLADATHTDVGASIERDIQAGRPSRIPVTHLADQVRAEPRVRRGGRVVVAAAAGDGLRNLVATAGPGTVSATPWQLTSAAAKCRVGGQSRYLLLGAE